MKLYSLSASDYESFWGKLPMPGELLTNRPIRNAVTIGASPNCDAFLILTTESEPYLVPNPNLENFVFIYKQEWGLTITPEVIDRVWRDLRKNAYPDIGDQLDSLFKNGVFPKEMSDKIQNIKNKYPKL